MDPDLMMEEGGVGKWALGEVQQGGLVPPPWILDRSNRRLQLLGGGYFNMTLIIYWCRKRSRATCVIASQKSTRAKNFAGVAPFSIDTIFRIFFWNIEGPQQLRNPEYSAEYKRCLTTVLALQSGIS